MNIVYDDHHKETIILCNIMYIAMENTKNIIL